MRRYSFVLGLALVFAMACAHAAPTKIDDPLKFVTQTYATTVTKAPEPDDIYTLRLSALFKLDRKEAGDGVGRIDFDFWMNGQDGEITQLSVSSQDMGEIKDRQIIVAKFKNFDEPNELHFFFDKTAAGWKLDDVRSLGKSPWVLSLILKYGWDMPV